MTAEEEIQAGIRNAMESGAPLDKIIQTFINAGYQETAVRAAANAVTEGALTIAHSTSPVSSPSVSLPAPSSPGPTGPPQRAQFPVPAERPNLSVPPEHKSRLKIILLVIMLLVLLGVLVASLLFREEVVALFS